ncbi:flagellin N-terminal helical domain-containing protein [Endothiovibrio diazotrophicus]
MPQVINTNVMSLNSQRNLNSTQGSMQVALQRLSSGLRINSAKDDAAGLAISTRFTAQITGLNQAVRNANDGISLAQTGEGALQEITNNLQRIRELAVQSANGTYTTGDRTSLQNEVSALQSEIIRITKAVEFNGVKILGASAEINFHVGAKAVSGVDYFSLNVSNLASANGTNGIGSALNGTGGALSIATQAGARSAITMIDTMLDRVSTVRADFGTIQNRFESVVRNLQNVSENLSASRSRIMDADFAAETAELTRTQILQQSGVAMLAQANQLPQQVLQLLG